MFEHFKQEYSKTYADEEIRFEHFKKSIAAANELNNEEGVNCAWSRSSNDLLSSSGESCPYGITLFSDMDKEEFKAQMLGLDTPGNETNLGEPMDPALYANGMSVSKKDWRSSGAVTPMKNQNPCGFCWAFSAVSTIESAYAIKYGGRAPILSPEEAVECSGHHQCSGRSAGGFYTTAWQDLKKHGGLSTESAYPTTCCGAGARGKTGTCKRTAPKVKVTGMSNGPKNENSLAAAVASQGPFSIAVAAEDWQHWRGGGKVMSKCSGSVDHAVSIVGFDKTASTPYWIVRNQWGANWGDKGYIKLAMGRNTCQITSAPAIVTVAKARMDEDVVV